MGKRASRTTVAKAGPDRRRFLMTVTAAAGFLRRLLLCSLAADENQYTRRSSSGR